MASKLTITMKLAEISSSMLKHTQQKNGFRWTDLAHFGSRDTPRDASEIVNWTTTTKKYADFFKNF